MRTCAVITAFIALLLCVGCNHGGLSGPFRDAAQDALHKLRAAGETRSDETLAASDVAVRKAHKKTRTYADMKAASVLDWYSILVHRYDQQRTQNWRKICDTEVELYLDGKQQGSTSIWNGSNYQPVAVARGACEQAAFQMMKQDCDELIATRGLKPSDCSTLEAQGDPGK